MIEYNKGREIMEKKRTNSICIIGFVLAFVSSFAGLVLSIIGLIQAKRVEEGGSGLAIAGIVISALKMIFLVIFILLFPIIIYFINGVVEEIDYYINDDFDNKCSYAYDCKSYDDDYSVCKYDNEYDITKKILCEK